MGIGEDFLFRLHQAKGRREALRLVPKEETAAIPEDPRSLPAFLARDEGSEIRVPVGTLPDGRPLVLPTSIAWKAAIEVGASGSGKTRKLLSRIKTEILWNLGLPAFGCPAPPSYRSDLELLDPKTETFDEVKKLVAALYASNPPERQREIRQMIRVFDWTAERVTPLPLYHLGGSDTSDAFLAHQRLDVEIAASRLTYTDGVKGLAFMYGRLLAVKDIPPNVAYARRFFRDPAFRAKELANLRSRDVAAYFASLEESLPRQTMEAFLRRLEHTLSFPEIRAAIGMPPDAVARLLPSQDHRITIGNYGPGTRLPLGKALERASHRLVDLLRNLPRRSPATPFFLLLEEAAMLLSQAGELTEPLANASRTLRAFNVGITLAAQDFAAALPKPLARTLLLNARSFVLFQSRDEAELVASFADEIPGLDGTSAQKKASLVREIQNLPTRHAYLYVKGYTPLRFVTLEMPDPAQAARMTDAELLEIFDREILPASTVPLAVADEEIRKWEAETVGAPSPAGKTPSGTRPKGIADLLAGFEEDES